MHAADRAHEAILRLLRTHGVEFSLHTHAPVRTIAEAERIVPDLTAGLLETIVFRIKGGEWVLAAVRAFERIDYRGLATAVGVRRTDLRSISAQEVEAAIGFQIGGVGPFRIRRDIHVVIDAGIHPHEWVYCGGGRNDRTIHLPVAGLIAASGAGYHPIVRGEAGAVAEHRAPRR